MAEFFPRLQPGEGGGTYKGGQGNSGPAQYCRAYLTAAQTALRGGRPQRHPPDPAQLEKFSKCMRANGIPGSPDPTANGLSLNMGGDLNPNSPAVQNASKLCAKKTGVRGLPGSGTPPGTTELAGGSGGNG